MPSPTPTAPTGIAISASPVIVLPLLAVDIASGVLGQCPSMQMPLSLLIAPWLTATPMTPVISAAPPAMVTTTPGTRDLGGGGGGSGGGSSTLGGGGAATMILTSNVFVSFSATVTVSRRSSL